MTSIKVAIVQNAKCTGSKVKFVMDNDDPVDTIAGYRFHGILTSKENKKGITIESSCSEEVLARLLCEEHPVVLNRSAGTDIPPIVNFKLLGICKNDMEASQLINK